jgi:hypothetical protein
VVYSKRYATDMFRDIASVDGDLPCNGDTDNDYSTKNGKKVRGTNRHVFMFKHKLLTLHQIPRDKRPESLPFQQHKPVHFT